MNTDGTEFRILGRDVIRKALPMADCIDLMTRTMIRVSEGGAKLPLRMVMPVGDDGRFLGIMPGFLDQPEAVGIKLVCLFPGNHDRNLSSHTGIVAIFDPETGQLRALLDGAEITAQRTPAATASASRALARSGSGDLAILGTGEQALGHLEALCIAHNPVRRVRLWGRSTESARALAGRAQSFSPVPIEVAGTAQEAVDGADIICTVTASADPVLKGEWIMKGAHINLVGASIPSRSELDAEGFGSGRVFVDYRPSALAQAGELRRAVEAGLVTEDHIVAEIGAVHAGLFPARLGEDDITIYKSLGIAAQDLAAADAVLRFALSNDAGRRATL